MGSPEAAKRIYQTRQRAYEKDLEWSYEPFLSLLGTGLLTANGDLWQRQRLLIGARQLYFKHSKAMQRRLRHVWVACMSPSCCCGATVVLSTEGDTSQRCTCAKFECCGVARFICAAF